DILDNHLDGAGSSIADVGADDLDAIALRNGQRPVVGRGASGGAGVDAISKAIGIAGAVATGQVAVAQVVGLGSAQVVMLGEYAGDGATAGQSAEAHNAAGGLTSVFVR